MLRCVQLLRQPRINRVQDVRRVGTDEVADPEGIEDAAVLREAAEVVGVIVRRHGGVENVMPWSRRKPVHVVEMVVGAGVDQDVSAAGRRRGAIESPHPTSIIESDIVSSRRLAR